MYTCPVSLRSSRIISLDIETTGLSPVINTIIELGVVEVLNGEVRTQYSRMFGGGRSPIYLVRNVHGIRDAEREGLSTFVESSRKIAGFLSNAILVTHNGTKFDIPFIENKLKEGGTSLTYSRHIDTYVISKRLKHEHNSLGWLCQNYGIAYGEDNHRGLTDCLCTLQLLYAMCDKFGEREVLG